MIDPSDLERGELELMGLLPFASNYSYLGRLCFPDTDSEIRVVYKPLEGESPLWDFPPGSLCLRETAAFVVSEISGWDLVPPTVLREGPLGLGAVQMFVDHDPRVTAFELIDGHRDALKTIAVFDHVVNNADRKAGHVLLDKVGKIWSVDHGICFHTEDKLRTVLWDFAGEPVTGNDRKPVLRLIDALESGLAERLEPLLDLAEVSELSARAKQFAKMEAMPGPGPGRRFPWPPV